EPIIPIPPSPRPTVPPASAARGRTDALRAPSTPPAAGPPRLLDRVRSLIQERRYSRRTERAYVFWIKRYLAFHGMRHPSELDAAEVRGFLSQLATTQGVSASTQNQAFSALLFLYREVLRQELAGLDEVVRAKRTARVPLVLSRTETA